VAASIADCLETQLQELDAFSIEELLDQRLKKLLNYGEYKA
jgi:acetyl-CoA carboxylase alpha subunit